MESSAYIEDFSRTPQYLEAKLFLFSQIDIKKNGSNTLHESVNSIFNTYQQQSSKIILVSKKIIIKLSFKSLNY